MESKVIISYKVAGEFLNVKVLNNYYIKDDKNVYCLGVKVKEADALTFKVKNSFSSEAQDKNHKYEYCKVIK